MAGLFVRGVRGECTQTKDPSIGRLPNGQVMRKGAQDVDRSCKGRVERERVEEGEERRMESGFEWGGSGSQEPRERI